MPKEERNKMIRAKSFWLRKLGEKNSLAKKIMKAKNYQAFIRQPNVTFERHKMLNNKRQRERERERERERYGENLEIFYGSQAEMAKLNGISISKRRMN